MNTVLIPETASGVGTFSIKDGFSVSESIAIKEVCQDPIVELNREALLQRSHIGIKKYGETLKDSPASLKEWLNHALEETLDNANYLRAAIVKIEEQENMTQDRTFQLPDTEENYLEFTIKNGIETLQTKCFQNSVNAGWHSDLETGKPLKRNKLELIALMHSELSEALEAIRKDLNDDKLPHRKGEEVELADCIIRIMDYAGLYELDLAGAILEKIAYNQQRADHKPENRRQENGKKF